MRPKKKRTTLLNQLDYHINQSYGDDSIHEILDEIRQNCIDNMIILCQLTHDVETVRLLQNLSVNQFRDNTYSNEDTNDYKHSNDNIIYSNDKEILKTISEIISNKWSNCKMVKRKYISECNLMDKNMEYFYAKIDEIMNINYKPNAIDIKKHNKLKTLSINDKKYKYSQNEFNNTKSMWFSEKDAIKLFTLPLFCNANIGFTINIPDIFKHRFFCPINKNSFVKKLKVQSIFNSKTKPYLIDCYVETNNVIRLSSQYILKKGDDMRFDYAILQMFNKMNEIWARNGLHVRSITYECIPIADYIGIIELKSNCISVNNCLQLRQDLLNSKQKFSQFIMSSVGAFISAFVCGVRDRHYDNILIDKESADLFHIDFAYIFGHETRINDASKIPITVKLKQIFDLYPFGWNQFVENALEAWLILRKKKNAQELIEFGVGLFKFHEEYNKLNKVKVYLTNSLKLNVSTNDAKEYMYNKLNAPCKIKTKLKNLWHDLEMLF